MRCILREQDHSIFTRQPKYLCRRGRARGEVSVRFGELPEPGSAAILRPFDKTAARYAPQYFRIGRWNDGLRGSLLRRLCRQSVSGAESVENGARLRLLLGTRKFGGRTGIGARRYVSSARANSLRLTRREAQPTAPPPWVVAVLGLRAPRFSSVKSSRQLSDSAGRSGS